MAARVFSVVLLLTVLELVRRRRLVEEYALAWIVLGVALIAVSARRSVLQAAGTWLSATGVPVSAAVAAAAGVCGAALWISAILSRQRRHIERLTEDAAILAAELRDLRSPRRRSSS